MRNITKAIAKAYLISGDLNGNRGKEMIKKHRTKVYNISDQQEIIQDWYEVGCDLRKAINRYGEKELMYHGK